MFGYSIFALGSIFLGLYKRIRVDVDVCVYKLFVTNSESSFDAVESLD